MDKKKSKIVELELWCEYSELPNPAWYEYKAAIEETDQASKDVEEPK